jgi:hypothetical protein
MKVIAATGLLGLATWAVVFAPFHVDDAYISLRYAANLCEGIGLRFNASGPPVEGYSNLLWTILVTPLTCGAVDPIVRVKALGFVLLLATAVLSGVFVRSRGASVSASAFAAAVVAVVPATVAWAFGGLEALLLSTLVMGALVMERSRYSAAAPVAWLCAALVRVDAIGLVLALVVGRAVFGAVLDADRTVWRKLALRLAVLALGLGAVTLWRLHVYGAPLPNTFYAKVDLGSAAWSSGLRYLLEARWALWFLALPLLPFAAPSERRVEVATLVAAVGAHVVYVASVGGDWMPMQRFLVPAVPLAGCAVALVIDRAGAERRDAVAAVVLLGMLLGSLVAFSGSRDASEVVANRWHVERFSVIGTLLDERVRPDGEIAVSAAGATPYFARRDAIDMLGLNDAHIARAPLPHGPVPASTGHARGDGAYVLDREPDVILLSSGARPTPSLYTSEAMIAFDPRFPARYRPVRLDSPAVDFAFVLPAIGRGVGDAVPHVGCERSGLIEVCTPDAPLPVHLWVRHGGGDAGPVAALASGVARFDLVTECGPALDSIARSRAAFDGAGIGLFADGWEAVAAHACGRPDVRDAAIGRAQSRGALEWTLFEYWLWTDPRFEGLFDSGGSD